MMFRNPKLAALLIACAVFSALVFAPLSKLVSLGIVIIVGVAAMAVANGAKSSDNYESTSSVGDTPEPSPTPYQGEEHLPSVPLRSARTNYPFTFSATVRWTSATSKVAEPGSIAANEIIRRAEEITQQHDPIHVTAAEHELKVALGRSEPDSKGNVYAKADSVELQLSEDDRQWLDKLDVLAKLVDAVSSGSSPGFTVPSRPQTPGDHFEAFLNSFRRIPADDMRLLLTKQVANFVTALGYQEVADELNRRHDGPVDLDDEPDSPE
jgi:hypothetical protein